MKLGAVGTFLRVGVRFIIGSGGDESRSITVSMNIKEKCKEDPWGIRPKDGSTSVTSNSGQGGI